MGWIKEVMPIGLVYPIKGMIAEDNKVAAAGESYGVTTIGKAYRGIDHFLFEMGPIICCANKLIIEWSGFPCPISSDFH